ncbi:MAG TPA: hypothetical protein VFD03_05675, partial [Clostridia bacterium]|nr:hypothetical protein [Clostridia bacterium]
MKDIDEMMDFFLYEKGESILVNGVEQIALIIDAVDKLTYYDDKIIRCKCQVKTGDIIEYNNLKYIIISQIDKNVNSYKAKIRKCNYSIAFNFNGNIKWFDALIETKVMDTDSNQYMTLAAGKIKVSLQDNANSRDIILSKRFINTGRAWEVAGIDKASKGLIILTADLTATITDDDLVNEIADRWKFEIVHTYVLNINNGAAMNVSLNDIAQLNIILTDNGIAMNPLPALTFLSSDSNIVAVDNNGKLMGINPGNATITCQMINNTSVLDTIDISVVEIISHSYTINVTGLITIKVSKTQSYVAHFYDNGIETFDKSVVWSIKNQDGTTAVAYAWITSSTGNSVSITAVTSSTYANKYVVLKATLADDETVFK